MNRQAYDDARVRIAWAIAMAMGAAATAWLLYLARHARLVIYVSVLLATASARSSGRSSATRSSAAIARCRGGCDSRRVLDDHGRVDDHRIPRHPLLVEQARELWTRLPSFVDQDVIDASRKITTKVSAWLSGQLILAGTIGSTAAIGLYLLGVPYFYVLALIAAIGEMVPVIGPILSSAPAILAGLSVSPQTAFFVAVFWVVQQQVENHLLVPKVMERQVGVSSVIVLVALLMGATALGILGALLAVPTAANIPVIVQELLDERDRAN